MGISGSGKAAGAIRPSYKISLFPISWCEKFHEVGRKKFFFRLSEIP